MGVGDYNGRAERLRVVLDHYLDLGLGLRDQTGETAIWPCPSCGEASFVARFEEGVAGCVEEGCGVASSMDLPELISHLDEGAQAGDRRGAGKRFSELLETSIEHEQELEQRRKGQSQQARQERYWRKGLARARARKRWGSEDSLF